MVKLLLGRNPLLAGHPFGLDELLAQEDEQHWSQSPISGASFRTILSHPN